MQHDPVLGRELPDLLGCRVYGQPPVGRTIPVAGRIQGRGELVRVRRADPGANASGLTWSGCSFADWRLRPMCRRAGVPTVAGTKREW